MKYNLKQIRELSGKTQSEVAGDLGLSLSTYRSWEQGKRNLNGKKISQLADYFGVSTDTIIGTEFAQLPTSFNEQLTKDEAYLLNLYRQMSDDDKESFIRSAQVYAFAGEAKKDSRSRIDAMACDAVTKTR